MILRTSLVLALATLAVTTVVVFVLALALSASVDLVGWALAFEPAHDAWPVLSLLQASAVCGLIVAPVGGAFFAADLRRQGWL